MRKKHKAFLFGPFFGELSWEFYRFAPYAIYLKKSNPNAKIVVLTRPSRFDFYGQFADIFVPLKPKGDSILGQEGFKLLDFKDEYYATIVKYFLEKYRKKFNIMGHIFPEVIDWTYKVKWQFPRDEMDYDFIPRKRNREIVEDILDEDQNIVFADNSIFNENIDGYKVIQSDKFLQSIADILNNEATYFGCLIELFRKVKFVIGNLESDASHLAILLHKPLIFLGNEMSDDSINLLNPFDTPIIKCDDIKDGVRIYENNVGLGSEK